MKRLVIALYLITYLLTLYSMVLGTIFQIEALRSPLDYFEQWMPGQTRPLQAACSYAPEYVASAPTFYCYALYYDGVVAFVSATGTNNTIQRTYMHPEGLRYGDLLALYGSPCRLRYGRHSTLVLWRNSTMVQAGIQRRGGLRALVNYIIIVRRN